MLAALMLYGCGDSGMYRPWRWEIYAAGKNKPVKQSDFFESMSDATRAGKAALAEIRASCAV